MKITKSVKQEVEVSAIRCEVAVRYEEEDMPNDYPHREGDMWIVTIDIETGQIRDWPAGVAPREIHMKVCDQGSYYLLGPAGSVVASIEQNYVPYFFPGFHYGDHIIFDIDAVGKIANWHSTKRAVESSFIGKD